MFFSLSEVSSLITKLFVNSLNDFIILYIPVESKPNIYEKLSFTSCITVAIEVRTLDKPSINKVLPDTLSISPVKSSNNVLPF